MSEAPVRLTRRPLPTASAVGTPAPPVPSDGERVTITIDGREVQATRGQWIITAAEEAGVYIPRFCYHPRMRPVGMCRMCLVEVSGPRGFALVPACYNPVADGMEIRTTSPAARKAQDGVLEFLLINHPLDCPVCDKGGECPLQDQTLAYGPGETRFVEEKRHWDKPIPISDLVYLDRERCIQCGRCVRFADEVAGDPLIDFAERGDETEVATFPDDPYASYFSGNVVQICPVGALTAKPYRFRARPWDLEQVESTCTSCAVGCRMAVQSSSDELTRYIGVDSDPVNWGWLCDKGRFGYEAVNSSDRLTVPLVRRGDELVEASWDEALDAAARGLGAALEAGGGASVAVIGGSRLANEDAYAWAKAARLALRTDNVDAQLGDGVPAPIVLGLPRATIADATRAPLVLSLGPDIKEELPVLYLRLRDAIRENGVQLVELASIPTGMSRYAAQTVRYRPGEAAALARAIVAPEAPAGDVAGVPAAELAIVRAHVARARSVAPEGSPPVVVILGRASVAESEAQIAEAARALADLPGAAFLSALRRANVHGALDLGLAPGVLPGRVGLDEGRAWYEHQWGATLPARAGLGTSGILDAASRGHIGGLVLLGADPLADFPDSTAALKGVLGARFVVAVDTHLTASSRRADVVLPAAAYAERRGTVTNLEGRITWLGQMVTAPGVAWPDWMIASELAARLGVDLGFTSLEEIWAEVTRVSPLHHGAGYDVVASSQGRDGVVVPVRAGGEEPPRPRALDPMADPGIASAEVHTVPPTALMVHGPGVNRTDAPAAGGPGPAGSVPDGSAGGAAPAEGEPAEGDAGQGDAGHGERPEGRAAEEAPAPPPRLGVPAAVPGAPVTPLDAYSLRLVARRSLWDGGTQVQRSPALANLHPPLQVRVHPSELARLGVAEGAPVRVGSPRGNLVLPAAADPGVPPGVAVVPVNLPGGGASALIDATAAAVNVRLSSDPAARGAGHG